MATTQEVTLVVQQVYPVVSGGEARDYQTLVASAEEEEGEEAIEISTRMRSGRLLLPWYLKWIEARYELVLRFRPPEYWIELHRTASGPRSGHTKGFTSLISCKHIACVYDDSGICPRNIQPIQLSDDPLIDAVTAL